MNILMIGNGFDLAHELPTKYTDFLEFGRMIQRVYDMDVDDEAEDAWTGLALKVSGGIDTLKTLFMKLYAARIVTARKHEENHVKEYIVTKTIYDEFSDHMKENIWIKYFLKNPKYRKENWIDFESEISTVIQSLDRDMYGLSGEGDIDDEVGILTNEFLDTESYDLLADEYTYRAIRDKLLDDLNRLIRMLEIYLCEYVEKIEIHKKSPDIENINADYVLSFNYTDTFLGLYSVTDKIGEKDGDAFDYIHGKADIGHTIETNNMVLGINEYILDDRKEQEVQFIAFKKYYQRIFKGTGSKYKYWVDRILSSGKLVKRDLRNEFPLQIPYKKFTNEGRHNLYIFGHSLDMTDKDVLRDFILNDNVYTIIFYFNRIDLSVKIANMVRAIGPDELIRRTGGATKTIEFRPQRDMVDKG